MDQLAVADGQMRSMTFALLALSMGATGCGAANSAGSGGTGAGTTGAGTTAQTTGATTSSTKAAATNASSSTGAPFVCSPPAAPGSLYENSANEFSTLVPISMCQYRGDVLLIIDTAAE
jgi:hypothetical protein